jgi:uncharacterized membrane protein
MLMAWRSRDLSLFAGVARFVVIADFLFTASAVLVQPTSGVGLVLLQGYRWSEPWLVWTYGLYVLTGALWLPVVWIQWKAARLAKAAQASGARWPDGIDTLMRAWSGPGGRRLARFWRYIGLCWPSPDERCGIRFQALKNHKILADSPYLGRKA